MCLFQPERRLLISGDHLLGRISLFYDYGWTPDPVGEFLHSLDVVDELDARLCLSGHGKPFVDVRGHIEGNRKLVAERLDAVLQALERRAADGVSRSSPSVYGEPLTRGQRAPGAPETLCYLRHLERAGPVARDGARRRWRAVASRCRLRQP